MGISPLEIQRRHDEAFDVEAVTKQFFANYQEVFQDLQQDLARQTKDRAFAHDYALQFLNRCMFLYFIQRKGWLGSNREFMRTFWESYRASGQKANSFVHDWLKVMFFEAFNDKFHGGHRHFPDKIKETLALAPYLNGGLFTENELDRKYSLEIMDTRFAQVFNLFERYNFTIAEDSPLDKEVAVDPEMIGKVYESLVNVEETSADQRSAAGIFYTPRTEIDLMCRLALVDHLANHLGTERKSLLYQLVFALEPEEKAQADKAFGEAGMWRALDERLRDITVLDPAAGSGSFLVGMLSILDDLQERANDVLGLQESAYNRKKRIIGQSLYGVDVMDWACHVAELRLWLSLIIDAEFTREELHIRDEPLLPHFTFKIRRGDSLVQEVGGINLGHMHGLHGVTHELKTRIKKLKDEKLKFYNNDSSRKFHDTREAMQEELRLFRDILDAQHHQIAEDIKTLRRKIEGDEWRQVGLLDGKVEEKSRQMELKAVEWQNQIQTLTQELEKIDGSREALKTAKDVPFVWDIAFVEIFEGEKAGFDIVIGNPPYVRQESIADPNMRPEDVSAENKKAYKAKLARSVYQAFPTFFGYKTANDTAAHKLGAKSDLYIYFYFHGLSLLNPKGSFCFITSNSWLDVGYGADLQEFLLNHSHVKIILDNQAKRSFASADVNTIIALLSPPEARSNQALNKTAKFVMFKVPFEHIVSAVIFDEIEAAYERKTTPEYRVFPEMQRKLLVEGCEPSDEEEVKSDGAPKKRGHGPLIKVAKYIGNKWGGKYLRAPEIYWTILEKGKGKLVRLGDIAEVRRGFTTGANEFFYLDKERIREWRIEKKFLRPVIKTPRDYYRIKMDGSDTFMFWCKEDKSSLTGTAALLYIKWGESREFSHVPSCRGRRNWYSLNGPEAPDLLWPSAFFERHIVYECPKGYVADKVFYTISGKVPSSAKAFLNSSITSLFVEVEGYQLNHGGIFVTTEWLSNLPVLVVEDKRLSMHYEQIASRDILLCGEELQLEDRRLLDSSMMEILGLEPRSSVDNLYEHIKIFVTGRIHKARREITKKGRS